MKHRPYRTPSVALLLSCAGVAWCAQAAMLAPGAPGAPASGAPPPPPLAAARVDLSTQVARAWLDVARHLRTACRQDDDCRSLGVGFRDCGGPERFVAWSASSTDEAALQAAGRHHARASRKLAAAYGESSTCVILPDPGAYCARPEGAAAAASGQCTLRQGQGALR